ncbi:MAG: hypothetical protein WC002_00675 [Candidatus Muiribacteriota bacterium]
MKKLLLILFTVLFVFTASALPKVLFDNTHAQTAGSAHWVINSYYSDMADDIERMGFEVNSLDIGPIKYEVIKNFDILIIPEPNNPFTKQEINDIIKFTREGGGLFLIADHYNSDRNNNGWDSVLIYNEFTEVFGFTFDKKTFSDAPVKGKRVEYSITKGVYNVGTWGGTSLKIVNPEIAEGVIFVQEKHGGNPYIAVAKYGKGRIVGIGDSSPFSDGTKSTGKKYHDNYNRDGFHHKQLNRNIIDFLSKKTGDDISIIK